MSTPRRSVLARGHTWQLLIDSNERLYYEYQLSDDCACCYSLLAEVSELYVRRFVRVLRRLRITPIVVDRQRVSGGTVAWAYYEARSARAATTWDAQRPVADDEAPEEYSVTRRSTYFEMVGKLIKGDVT